jgi:hypothetical protein
MTASILALLAAAAPAAACRGPFPAPISIEEAYARADAVFLGRVVSIQEGLPTDFVPPDAKALEERRTNLKRQGKSSLGRTITFAYQRNWKGPRRDRYVLAELTAENTCEWNYDAQVGDRFIIFAASNGNYLSWPALMFDGRSLYTKLDPLSRRRTGEDVRLHRDALRKERAEYMTVLNALNGKLSVLAVPARHAPYAHAVIENSCAPTDGLAYAIIFSSTPIECGKPTDSPLGFSIDRDLPTGPTIYPISLTGAVNVIRRGVPYSPVKSGKLKLKLFESGKRAAGSYEVEFRDGSVEKGEFDAPWCAVRQFCG